MALGACQVLLPLCVDVSTDTNTRFSDHSGFALSFVSQSAPRQIAFEERLITQAAQCTSDCPLLRLQCLRESLRCFKRQDDSC
jgi:hypothetical protein